MKTIINIAKDFSSFPAGRYEIDGPFTGEGFRKKHLVNSLKMSEQVIVDFENVLSPGSSFLDEAFGGLVREEGFDKVELLQKLDILNAKDSVKKTIIQYINEAAA